MAEVIPIGREASGKPPLTRPSTRTVELSTHDSSPLADERAGSDAVAVAEPPASSAHDALRRTYAEALHAYMLQGAEAHLQQAYDLGRSAGRAGVGLLDLVRLHHSVLSSEPSRDAGRVEAFLLEALSPFEAMHRGFRQAHDQLRRRERQLAQAQQLACLGSFEWDWRVDRVVQSDELHRICGRSSPTPSQTLAEFLSCVHDADRTALRELFLLATQQSGCFTADFRLLTLDGARREIHLRGEAVLDSHQRPARIVGFFQDITERRRVERELHESRAHYERLFTDARAMEETLRKLSGRLVHAQEAERAHFSRELHDEVGQALNAMAMNLGAIAQHESCREAALAARIADTVGLLERTIENVHRFARELRPAMLDELGLDPALRALVRGFAERTGHSVEFHGKLPGELLAADQRTVVYRVAQESLNNVAKHASATHVDVILWREGDQAILEIRDNGRGFSPAPQRIVEPDRQRLGLLGMEERVRLINGSFHIESRPGAGAIVRVEIPLVRSDPCVPEAGGVAPAVADSNQPNPIPYPKDNSS